LQTLVVLGLGFYLFSTFNSGKLLWYINARFAILTLIGMLMLFALAGNALEVMRRSRRSGQNHQHAHQEHSHSPWSLAWLALPVFLGLIIPARPLGSSAAEIRGISISAPLAAGGVQPRLLEAAPDERNVLDWIRLFNYESDLAAYLGQTANVIGFVYSDPRLPAGHFLVARFTVSCCVADAFAIGMAVEWPGAGELPADQWVKVKGPVQGLEIDGQRIPLIQAETVTPVDPPDQPYLYP
jgi:uncharacterized repeat protein (TIGR03943 family)